ncbi:unnamed protein product [Pelagomonas calceolata]|uniref:HIRAN domain-containing protein n=1 Tax=Pelagomonas calceolata TaxID=35677 RepID=A0A8J2SQI1_9STRA|nr:unnamed protein product [Pelagomonas calceolata]
MKRGSNTRRFRIPTPTQKKSKTSPATTPASSGSDEASLLARLQPSDARPAAEAPRGFKTAALVAATPPSDEPPAPEEPARESSPTNVASPAAPPAQDENAATTSLELQVVGLRYRDGHRFLREGAAVTLRREPNEHDANAIEAWIPGDLAPVQLGFLRRGAAAALAPLIDEGVVTIASCVCCAAEEDAFDVLAVTTLRGPAAVLAGLASALDVGEASLTASRRDCEDAVRWAERHGDAPTARLDWDPATGATVRDGSVVRDYRAPGDAVPLGWVPYGDVGTVDAEERSAASWPPADAALAKLGLAPAEDARWYASLGLRPPRDWTVAGPLDNLASTTRDVRKIRDKLDGAIHGAGGCFIDSFLDEIRARVAETSFWCRDSDFEAERDAEQSEKLVACIGAPMVIGDATARLLKARRHDDLSRKMCRALGVVYAAAHLCPVAAPGFNSLIISARRRGSGFWWHQDQVPQQKAQTTLAPRQAVATLILYEKAQTDSGADCVRWKPVQNWEDSGLERKLGAARTLPTTDALVHLQREGLQPHAKHAVHHTPGAPPRTGARIVVTARIAKLDAWDAVDVPAVREMPAIGPDGDVTLPLVWG